MLPGSGLGDDAALAEPPRQHRLAERVVELVCAGVEEILALQVQPLVRLEPLGARERRRAARERAPERVELLVEGGVVLCVAPARLELVERGDQRFRHVAAAVGAEEPGRRAHLAAATNARTLS